MLSPVVLCYEVIMITITNMISFILKNFSEADVITAILQIKKLKFGVVKTCTKKPKPTELERDRQKPGLSDSKTTMAQGFHL